MKLTPLDIKRQEFKKVFMMRGYDVIEVDAFLEMVADEYESMLRVKNESISRIKQLEEKLKEYQEIEKTLQKTLMDAQKSLSKSKEDSKKEAELIIKEAEITANKIIEDSRRELVKLKNEIVLFKAQKDSLAIRLKHILNSQIELIKILEMDEQEVAEFKKGEKKTTETPKSEVSKETLLGTDEDKGKSKSGNEQNLIEKMVLEIDDEEAKKEKPNKEDTNSENIMKKNKK